MRCLYAPSCLLVTVLACLATVTNSQEGTDEPMDLVKSALEFVARVSSTSEVLTLNLTNLAILIGLKILFFAFAIFGFAIFSNRGQSSGYGSGGGYGGGGGGYGGGGGGGGGYGRSFNDEDTSINESTFDEQESISSIFGDAASAATSGAGQETAGNPWGTISFKQSELTGGLCFIRYASGETDKRSCLLRAACEDPETANKYLTVGKFWHKLHKFLSFIPFNEEYYSIMNEVEEATKHSFARSGDCTKYKW